MKNALVTLWAATIAYFAVFVHVEIVFNIYAFLVFLMTAVLMLIYLVFFINMRHMTSSLAKSPNVKDNMFWVVINNAIAISSALYLAYTGYILLPLALAFNTIASYNLKLMHKIAKQKAQ